MWIYWHLTMLGTPALTTLRDIPGGGAMQATGIGYIGVAGNKWKRCAQDAILCGTRSEFYLVSVSPGTITHIHLFDFESR